MNGKVKRAGRLAAIAAAAGLLFLSSAGTARAQTPADVLQQVRFDQKINRPLPLELNFRDETGRTVALGDYFGRRPVVLAFVYYECPMLCTFVLDGLVTNLRPLSFKPGQDFEVVVVSFNPRETPAQAAAKKKQYVTQYGRPETAAGWHFLTGDKDSIAALTEAAGFHYLYDPETGQYAHAGGVMVVTPQGKLFRYFYGIDYPSRDLRLALVEASENKLGTLGDQVLLFCYHYDPRNGKYGLLIMRIIQVLGLGTVLALGSFVLLMLRRDRAKGRAA